MRKILLSLLVATTAATPAIAQRASSSDDRENAREERRSERAQSRESRSQDRQASRAERVRQQETQSAPRADRAQPAQQPAHQVDRTQRQAPAPQANQVRESSAQPSRRAPNVNERGRPTLDQGNRAERTIERVRQNSPVLQQERQITRDRPVRHAERPRRVAPPPGARPDRPAPPPATATHTRAPTWNTAWRHDRRHDWRRFRDRNRSHFRIGIYFDPFGWNYRRYNVGWRLWPSYYSSSYWLHDPFMYRLPYAPWPYRWVRYYNDVLLVNTMNGQVVDVIYDFFW